MIAKSRMIERYSRNIDGTFTPRIDTIVCFPSKPRQDRLAGLGLGIGLMLAARLGKHVRRAMDRNKELGAGILRRFGRALRR